MACYNRKQEKETIKELLTNEKVQFTLTEAAEKEKKCLVKNERKPSEIIAKKVGQRFCVPRKLSNYFSARARKLSHLPWPPRGRPHSPSASW